MSLDGVAEVLSWSPGGLDLSQLNVWAQVVLVAWMIGAKAGAEAARAREGRRLVEELGRRLGVRPTDGTGTPG